MSATTAQPAEPILAHSLLQNLGSREYPVYSDKNSPKPTRNANAWNLRLDIDKGLHSHSTEEEDEGIFRPGTIIGFSRLRARSPEGNEDEFVGELPRHLLTKWLLRQRTSASTSSGSSTVQQQSKTYIIHPPHNSIFSPSKLLSCLQTHSPSLTRQDAIKLLDSVELFPVFDFSAAVDAITVISERVHALYQHQHEQQQKNQEEHQEDQEKAQTTVIITGLDTLIEGVIRSSNAVRGTAVLASALRTLTQLARSQMHRASLSVLLVNTSGVGPGLFSISQHNQSQSQTQNQTQEMQTQSRSQGDSAHSMFSLTDAPLFPSLLMRTLDAGIDTHVLVSRSDLTMLGGGGGGVRGPRATVVEVVKDRVGNGLGRWCVWPGTGSG